MDVTIETAIKEPFRRRGFITNFNSLILPTFRYIPHDRLSTIWGKQTSTLETGNEV
jgi:hypothetical protein